MLKIETNKKIAPFTTFGIGGDAKYFITAHTIDEMQEALLFAKRKKLPYFILGKGSNTLMNDRGFNGVVILNKIDFLKTKGDGIFHVGAGYPFSLLGTRTARAGWEGLEFASGIPGTVGGAVYMNAGANGIETVDHLLSVDFINSNGDVVNYPAESLTFSYRTSPFQKDGGVIVGATFQLTPSVSVREKQKKLIHTRRESQPYSAKSAGCLFQNPLPDTAGALIDQCGLKGAKIGGAMVSDVHANFIVNTGNATAKDVLALIELVRHKVKEKTGKELHHEVRFIPYA